MCVSGHVSFIGMFRLPSDPGCKSRVQAILTGQGLNWFGCEAVSGSGHGISEGSGKVVPGTLSDRKYLFLLDFNDLIYPAYMLVSYLLDDLLSVFLLVFRQTLLFQVFQFVKKPFTA